jgi:hypothetical protein
MQTPTPTDQQFHGGHFRCAARNLLPSCLPQPPSHYFNRLSR